MKVVVIGSGGREHALAWKIAQSKSLEKLFIIPGNPGTGQIGVNVEMNLSEHDRIIELCKKNSIDLIVIGPEQPLVDGLGNKLRNAGLNVFGPNKEAAMIEGDKSFSKELMTKHGIPTAEYQLFNRNEKESTLSYLEKATYPLVIKASGLAAGKGVAICHNYESAVKILHEYFDENIFGESGHKIVIEEFLEGEEASIFVITDGDKYVILPASQDHKRALDGDKGKNTGGMGAYAPAPIISKSLLIQIENEIIIPTLAGLRDEKKKYNGCLYCGLIITKEGPKVIEYNCRFGDPETQCVLPLLDGDFLDLLFSTANGNINVDSIKYIAGASVCVVAASEGYPEKYEKGFEIFGLDNDYKDVVVFHAGTIKRGEKIITNGGRVLGVTSHINDNDLKAAKIIAYDALSKINYMGKTFRMDIADRGINK
ncbi:MAG: phosphoribosylamine--glycine ligase [Melioribacteraceae bacterium]|nr:phosphoribosylamine--glycine ligase [Melioribacteraceae bacterium]MCF8352813.1 phosphoribosylamine--glycine ligase [Melioribacteraceae bacterium]MCF8393467.1 phosphoribosylamine--glycine ligase [Melioribacteraceae bacterium]MCF8417330.1 phosphoribosylamine--glycine ligase [Melioribacteraceae bacterium]